MKERDRVKEIETDETERERVIQKREKKNSGDKERNKEETEREG